MARSSAAGPGHFKIKELRADAPQRKARRMAGRVTHTWQYLRRQLRLAARHARIGRASFGGTASPVKAEELAHVFRVVNGFLRELGVEYALAYGTLLGWHRERRILPHDRDVDFAALGAAYPLIWAARTRLPAGFTMHDTTFWHRGPKLYIEHRGWDADIYFFMECGDGARLESRENCINPGDIAPFPRSYFLPVQPAEFLGERTFVPAQAEALLTHHYGYLGADAVRDPVTRYFRRRT